MGEKFGLGRHKHNLDGHDGGRDGRTEGGKEGFCIQLNCAGEGECQNRERDRGENRSGKGGRGTRVARKGDLSSMALSAESKTKMLCTSVKGFHV